MMRGTVCGNVRTYGSAGALGEQSPRATRSAASLLHSFGAHSVKSQARFLEKVEPSEEVRWDTCRVTIVSKQKQELRGEPKPYR